MFLFSFIFFLIITKSLQVKISSSYDCQNVIKNLHNDYICEQDEKISNSDSSIVYKIKRKEDNKIFILKVLPKIKNARFEIHCLIRLKKEPYVIQLIENYEDNQNYYEVLQYAKNGTLERYRFLNFFKFDDQNFILDFFAKIVEAVKSIHSYDIIHADLKPDNIFIDEKLNPVVADFNKSQRKNKLAEAQASDRYQDPIIIQQHNVDLIKYDEKIDIYALGCILYYLLTGQPPFNSNKEGKLRLQLLYGLIKIPKGTSYKIVRILEGALQYQPKNRFSIQQIQDIIYEHGDQILKDDIQIHNKEFLFQRQEQSISPYIIIAAVFFLVFFSLIVYYFFFLKKEKKTQVTIANTSSIIDRMSEINIQSPYHTKKRNFNDELNQ